MFAIVDIETTGSQPPADRMTEIAIVLHDGRRVERRYQTLLNPERPIPPMVTQLTGITAAMVAEAPRFYQVAREIVELTEGRIFVAHNVGFDYAFLRAAFSELGYPFQRPTLCTVRLSRQLVPGLPSYSLGKLCTSLGITVSDRHRAGGDADATAALLDYLLRDHWADAGSPDAPSEPPASVLALIDSEVHGPKLPPKLERGVVDALPHATGVYWFHDEQGHVLYVGKSINIHQRILSHLQVDLKKRHGLELKAQLAGITYEKTGSELIALLYESAQIKALRPPFNRVGRLRGGHYAIYQGTNAQGYHTLQAKPYSGQRTPPKKPGELILLAEHARRAHSFLEGRARKYGLCKKLLGIERGHGPCLEAQLHRHARTGEGCAGACMGTESVEAYNAKVAQALHRVRYPYPTFAVVGRGRTPDEQSVVWVEGGQYRGYGYLPADEGVTSPDAIRAAITPHDETRDAHALICAYLLSNHPDRVVPFAAGDDALVLGAQAAEA